MADDATRAEPRQGAETKRCPECEGENLSEDQHHCWDCGAADYWVPDYMSEDDLRYIAANPEPKEGDK